MMEEADMARKELVGRDIRFLHGPFEGQKGKIVGVSQKISPTVGLYIEAHPYDASSDGALITTHPALRGPYPADHFELIPLAENANFTDIPTPRRP